VTTIKRVAALAFATTALVAAIVRPAEAYDPYWTRDPQAWDYARDGVHERYVFGGAKFRNNDQWDSDEGADCSGYAAKVWAVDRYTYPMTFYHPFSTRDFYYGFEYGVFKDRSVGKLLTTWTYRSDAGGPGDHMGFFRTKKADGSWTTYEARGSSYGIIVHTRKISTLISWNYKRSDRMSWG
jgi:hypothetical protein